MWQKINNLQEKLSTIFNERCASNTNEFDRDPVFLAPTMLADFLHYEAFDVETELFINKNSTGFILEASPLVSANEETINILTSIITDNISKNIDVQFLLWGSNKIGNILENFAKERSSKSEIFSWLTKKRVEYLQKGSQESLTSSGSFLLRDFRLFISISQSSKNFSDASSQLLRIREDLISSLKSINISNTILKIEDFLSVIVDLINPSISTCPAKRTWNQFDSLSLQITDAELKCSVLKDRLVFNNGDDDIEVRSFTVKDWPKSMNQWRMTDSIGQLFNSSLQIPCPFLLSFSLRVLDAEKSSLSTQYKYMNTEKIAKSPLAKFKPLINQEYEDWNYVRTKIAEGDKLVKTFFQIIIYSQKKDGVSCERRVRDLYRANGWKLHKEIYLQFQSWLAMLPMRMSEGMYEDLKVLGRLRTLTAFNAINLAPLQGEWKGSQTASLILPGRRGQIATWNPFDNMEGNYNIAIAAASGKGKSMFTQEYITCLLGKGAKVWVIDIGRSYEKTCKMLGGTFIEFTPEQNISLNPFSFISDFESSLLLLKPLLAVMARPSSQVSDEEIAFLEKAIKAAWIEKGNLASISTVANWLCAQTSLICKNLGDLLYSYTSDGMYGRYFEDKANINLNDSFVVLELQELKAKKDLQKIILLVLMYQISEAMYLGKRSQIKTCIIDEAWDLLSGENDGAAKFIETGYRTARRFRANFVTITQSINDYFKNSTSIAAFENSDFNIIFGQKEEAIEQLKKNNRFSLNPFSEKLFKSLKKTDDYSECIIKGPSGLSIHRVIFDSFSRILYSSKGEEYEAVNKLVSEGKSLLEAILIVAEKFNFDNSLTI